MIRKLCEDISSEQALFIRVLKSIFQILQLKNK